MRTQNVSEQYQKHFCVPDTKFVSATNAARAGKRVNICVGNNVSSFARVLILLGSKSGNDAQLRDRKSSESFRSRKKTNFSLPNRVLAAAQD